MHVPSRTLHHPANPLYPIILLSHPFSTPVTSRLMFSNQAISITAPRFWHDLRPELFLYLHHRYCQLQDQNESHVGKLQVLGKQRNMIKSIFFSFPSFTRNGHRNMSLAFLMSHI